MTESALSDEADELYRPLDGVVQWAAAAVGAPAGPVARLGPPTTAWAELLDRGALLAAAHQSGALDGMHDGDRRVALSLLRGLSPVAALPADVGDHVRANDAALRRVIGAGPAELASEPFIRDLHRVACRPQLTHPVRGETGVHDHVLATGDFKHHPNHGRAASGGWVAHVPVADLAGEMGRFLESLGGDDFAALPPVARAAYAHHGLSHVAPFADGNGRVARALATAHLWPATGVPLLVFADQSQEYDHAVVAAAGGDAAALLGFLADRARDLVELLDGLRAAGPTTPEEGGALDRWQAGTEAAAAVATLLPGAVDRAITRHRRRSDLGWLSALTDATVEPGPPLVIRDPITGVAEQVDVDGHPVDGKGLLALRAREAGLTLEAPPAALLPSVSDAFGSQLDGWLDRAVSTLALRVAAELE